MVTPWNDIEKIAFLGSRHFLQPCFRYEEFVGMMQMVPPRTCAVHLGRAEFHSGHPALRRSQTWQAISSREEVVERCRRCAVSERRRPNAVVRILSSAPLYKMLPYCQKGGMERECSGRRRNTRLAGWATLLGQRSYLYRTLSLTQVYSHLKMKTVIPKKNWGRHEEGRATSQPGGVRDGDVTRPILLLNPF